MMTRKHGILVKSRLFCVVLVFCLGALHIGCGGGMAPQGQRCEDNFARLVNKKNDEICSPILFNQFEGHVTEWRSECGSGADPNKKQLISQKLKSARECNEELRQREMLSNSCSTRLAEVANAQTCLGEECVPALEELKEIAAACDVPVLKGKHSEEIAQAIKRFEERKNEKKKLESLKVLIMTCDEIFEVPNQRQARRHLATVINTISETEGFGKPSDPGSEVGRFQKGAIDSCGYALTKVTEKLTEVTQDELDRIAGSAKRQNRYIKKFKKFGERLKKINAAALFPGALVPLSDVLGKLGVSEEELAALHEVPQSDAEPGKASNEEHEKAKEEHVKEEISQVAQTDAESPTEPSGAEPSESVQEEAVQEEDPSTAKKCKELDKKLKHFIAKANAYEKKGNQAKTRAYRAKQEETHRKMEESGCSTPSSVGSVHASRQ